MLESTYEPEEILCDNQDDFEIILKQNQDIDTDTQTQPTVMYQMASSVTSKLKKGFVAASSIVGGCATVATMTPYAIRAVTCHLIPSATVPGAMASTVSGSLTIASYSIGSSVAEAGAEAISDLSSAAMTYLFNKPKRNADLKTHIEIKSMKLDSI